MKYNNILDTFTLFPVFRVKVTVPILNEKIDIALVPSFMDELAFTSHKCLD